MVGPGTRIGPFEVLSLVGAGGMGEVYRARDTRLGREVAVKVLPADVAADPERLRRFEREARATAALSHPNILAVHDIGSHEGVPYLVEELLEGGSLKDRLAHGALAVREAVQIGVEIARGLAAAHEKGIVHRDLKPGNVFLTRDGTVKILDFGLAKLISPSTGPDMVAAATTISETTELGTVLGTVAYMAPEQARGGVIDSRTDVFALGVVLYEMLSGRRPFEGATTTDTLASILRDEPAPLPGNVPPLIVAVVQRCLAKEPERRYRRGSELRAALEAVQSGAALAPGPRSAITGSRHWWLAGAAALAVVAALAAILVVVDSGGLRRRPSGGSAGLRIASLAVMPFVNLSGDPEQEYLAEGMHEALLTDLAQLSGLERVIARSSAMRYKGSTASPRQIAKELKVAALVTGAVLRSGERVRVTAHLIDPATEAELWARSYERSLSDVLALQNDIVAAISREIRMQLTPQERERLAKARSVDPAAYDAYLKGRFWVNKMTPEGFEKGIAYLQQAVDADPTNPLPYAVLALAYSQIGHEAMPEAFTKAKTAVARAQELGGSLAETEAAFADIALMSDWNWPEAERAYRRALALNPSLGEAHGSYSWYLWLLRRQDEAHAEMLRAMEVDPLNPLWGAWLGWQYWEEGRYEAAIAEAHKALELNPDFPWALHVLGGALASQGKLDEAIAVHERAAAASPATKWSLGHTLALAGRKEAARAIAAELEENPGPMESWGLAQIYTALGDRETALHWLETARETRFSFMPWVEMEPAFAPLHGDPRFEEVVRRVDPPVR